MNYEFTTLCYVRFLSGIFALILVGFLWRRRHSQGAAYLLLFELAAAIWAIADGFEAGAANIPLKTIWAQIAYFGITTSAVMFLLFALSFTNHLRKNTVRTVLLFMVIPALTVFMAFTNPVHHLLWTKIMILAGTNNTVYYYGPYFWFNVTYEYAALVSGILILLTRAFKVYSVYRFQFWILVLASLLPFAASIGYVFKLFPIRGIDPTPISFILTGIIVAVSLYWMRMFNIMPIARKQAIDNLRDGLMVVNSGNQIVDVNPAFCSIMKMPENQILRSTTEAVFSKLNISVDQFTAENDFTIEIQLPDKTDFLYYEVKYQEVIDKNQMVIGSIFLFLDITTKKLILETIADSNNDRRIEILEKEKLIRDLDAYARSVAHDLKNPIGSVVSMSELIKLSLLQNKNDEVMEMISMVHEQSVRMTSIIDDLLILSRIRKEDVKIKSVDISKILCEVMKRLHSDIESHNATFEMPETWPKVLGHNMWLEQVWMNLISNALKYGGVPPVIKLGFEKESSSIYRFYVTDNGSGLTKESMAKIFGDFERLGRKDIQGYGLGLSIVKRIIEKLGGDIRVESKNIPGEGCVFSFTLNTEMNTSTTKYQIYD